MSRRRLSLVLASLAVIFGVLVGGQRLGALVHLSCGGANCVSVTPDADALTKDVGDLFLTNFTVTNTGTATGTFEYTTACSGGATCEIVSTPPTTLTSGQAGTFKLSVTMGSSNGVVKVRATGTAADSGWKNVTVVPVVTMTAPALTSDTTAVVYSKMPLLQATFLPNDANLDTTTLVVVVGSDTVTSLVRRNRGLVEWQLDSARALTSGVLKKVAVKICMTNGQCTTRTRYYKLDDSGKPWVAFDGMPFEAQGRVFSAPFGPGLSLSGAEVETGFAVPGYVSMGVGRSVGLSYSTRQSHPRALVNADIELTWPAGTPDSIKAVLIDGVSRLDSVRIASPDCSAAVGRRCRVALQADFAASSFTVATRKWLKVEVSVRSSGTTKTTTDSVEVVVVDRRSTSYGNGWAVAGVLRLDSAGTDMILVGSTGTATIFRGQGGVYLPPPGDYSLLVWTGSVWELRFRAGGKLVFDAQGRQTGIVDIDGNQTTIAYSSSSDRITSITDPVSKQFTFSYDGSNKIATISNNNVQSNKISVNGSNQLTYDSTSSPTSRPYTETFKYTSSGSNSAILLRYRANAVGDSTTVGYSARYRPLEDSLPAVLSESGSSLTRPRIKYLSQETRALDSLISADSVYVRLVDPNGNWTHSALNRWGAAIRTWDALGTLARASFTPEGFVAWSEGKVADSTRVYHNYDASGHLVRSYRWRAGGDMVRLDSLVYNANHWVTQRIDARAKVSRVGYDGEGHVSWSATPTNDTTRFWYSNEGLLDSSRAPGQTKSSVVTRDGTWKNTIATADPDGRGGSVQLDILGRDSASQRQVTVRRVGSSVTYQWRRTLVMRNAAGQMTSTRVERTDNCTSCTGGPPAWPNLATDTLNFDSVYVVYSRVGGDSLRVNIRGKAQRVLVDALGRVRISAPWFTSNPTEVDSFRYDLGGRLRYQWTRRGVAVEHQYDSRNRDTLSIVPGVGTYRNAFAGPNDEMTRAWIDSYVDSIGGVNPEVRFGYGQAGQLLADTSQGTRVVTHLYDRYGRDTLMTDVHGTWRMRYDTERGVLDTVTTPFADSLLYSYDSRGRINGPTVRSSSSSPLVASWDWSMAGQLQSATFTKGSYLLGGLTNVDTTDAVANLRLAWGEQHGSGDTQRNSEDSVTNDGFERVLAVQYVRTGSLIATDTFSFDRDGGITVAGESRGYEVGTTRMTSRGSHSYTYDAAGNMLSDSVLGGGWRYGYDAQDRLVSARYNGTLIARYGYDVVGRRVARRVYSTGPNSATTGYFRMIYASGQVTAESDSGGTLTLGYVWGMGADDLVGVHDYTGNAHYDVAQDGLHSVRGVAKRDGSWYATYRYRAYGAQLDSAGSVPFRLRYRWIGREFDDETGLYHVRARYYDPNSQRFSQEDPTGFAGGSNVYAYGDGNPTNGRDLDGLEKQYDISGSDSKDDLIRDCMGTTDGCMSDDSDWSTGGTGQFDRLRAQAVQHSVDRAMAIVSRGGCRTKLEAAIQAICQMAAVVYAEASARNNPKEMLAIAYQVVNRAQSSGFAPNSGDLATDIVRQLGFARDGRPAEFNATSPGCREPAVPCVIKSPHAQAIEYLYEGGAGADSGRMETAIRASATAFYSGSDKTYPFRFNFGGRTYSAGWRRNCGGAEPRRIGGSWFC